MLFWRGITGPGLVGGILYFLKASQKTINLLINFIAPSCLNLSSTLCGTRQEKPIIPEQGFLSGSDTAGMPQKSRSRKNM